MEEENINGVCVVLGAQVEKTHEVGLEPGKPAEFEVIAVVAVEEVEVSKGRSSATCKYEHFL